MPTTVRQDGRQQSVGEVQNTINFQLLIATPTTLLLADNSHLALDARGAEIMRAFYRDLVETQRRMEAEPQRVLAAFPCGARGQRVMLNRPHLPLWRPHGACGECGCRDRRSRNGGSVVFASLDRHCL